MGGTISGAQANAALTKAAANKVANATILQTVETGRVLHMISEGECVGLADTVNPAKSVFFNTTALQDASSGVFNYPGVKLVQSYGTPTQTYIPGFSSAETPISVNVEVKFGIPVTRTTSTSSVDSARVTIQFPTGLQSIDGKGNSNHTPVSLTISTKLTSSGTWTPVFSADITDGKAEAGYEKDYYVTRPAGTGTWDIKVDRNTADSATPNTLANKTTFYRLTEIQDVKQAYANSALVSLVYDAKNAPDSFPQTFDYIGLKVAVPSNYNPVTRVYTGTWDGTFSSTKQWTDNPAYHLYEALTNTRWGLGNFITPAQVDKASFYAAGVYNDGLVDDGKGTSTTEPRYTFNTQIAQQEDAWKFIQMIASTFNAMVFVSVSGLVRLVQDRPTSPSVLVTNADIHANGFQYSSGASATRPTSTRVSFNDVNDSWRQKSIVETDVSTSFPFLQTTAQAWGCTTEGQARRVARWMNDTNLRNTRIVSYKAPIHHVNVEPGTVITLMDNVFAASTLGGRVVSVSGTTVLLDRPVTITTGTNKITVKLQDGSTLEQKTISTAAGSYSTITIASAFSQAVTPGADFIVEGGISAQTYRVTDIKEDGEGWYDVTAIQYDAAKYARIETGVSVAAPVYSDVAVNVVPTAVTGLTYLLQSSTAIDTTTRDLKVSWTKGTNNSTYFVQWRLTGDTWTEIQNVGQTSFTIKGVQQGQYDINVYAISKYGQQSPVCSGSYGVDLTGTTTAVINPVTSLIVVGGGTAFLGQDLSVQWTNPTSNANLNPALKDFVVNVYTTGGTLLRTETVAGVAAGSSATYTYTYTKNLADNANVPIRSIRVDVLARDGLNNTVAATSNTFTNAAPAIPSNIVATGLVGTIQVSLTLPTDIDFKGVIAWMSTTSGFTPGTGNQIIDGSDNVFQMKMITPGVPHYIKIAAYDSFGKSYAGTGLNVSTQFSATPVSNAGINSGGTNPGTGAEGDVFYNTTDGQLYRYHSGAWTVYVPTSALTGTISTAQIAANAIDLTKFASGLTPVQVVGALPGSGTEGQTAMLTTDGKLYRYHSGAWLEAVDGADLVANSVTTGSIAAGAINTNQLAAEAITTDKLFVTGQGSTLNQDPFGTDSTAWTQISGVTNFVTGITDLPVGSTGMANTAGLACRVVTSSMIPVDQAKNYRLQAYAKQSGATTGVVYFLVSWYDAAGVYLASSTAQPTGAGSPVGWGSNGAYSYWTVGAVVPTTWTRYTGSFGPGETAKIPSNARFMAIGSIMNNTTVASSVIQVSGLTVMEKAVADLIVDGTITGTKLVANTISTGQLAASAVTSNELAANSVIAGKIAAATVTASELAANSVIAGKIAANAVTATELSAGSVIAGKLAANSVVASNISVTNLAAISASLGSVSGGQYTTGAFTGYTWPAAGAGGGSYLGPSGLLIGSANDGKYFQVTAAGDIAAPGFSIVGGNATFSGTLTVGIASGGSTSSTLASNVTIAGGATSISSGQVAGATYTVGSGDILLICNLNVFLNTNTNTPYDTILNIYDGTSTSLFNGSTNPQPLIVGTLSNVKIGGSAYNWTVSNNFDLSLLIPAGTLTAGSHTFYYSVQTNYLTASGTANTVTGSSQSCSGQMKVREFKA